MHISRNSRTCTADYCEVICFGCQFSMNCSIISRVTGPTCRATTSPSGVGAQFAPPLCSNSFFITSSSLPPDREPLLQFLEHLHGLHRLERIVIDSTGAEARTFLERVARDRLEELCELVLDGNGVPWVSRREETEVPCHDRDRRTIWHDRATLQSFDDE